MIGARSAVVALAVVVALVVVGCSGGDGTEETTATTQQSSLRYVINLTASAQNSETILVRGQTNLPDSAVVTISVSQAFRFKRERDTRASHLAGATATVDSGEFITTLGPLDYGDITVGLEHGVGDLEYGPVALVDNAVTVCAELKTGEDFDGVPRQHDEAVRDAVGPFGENLKSSPQANEFGSLTDTPSYWLEVLKRVKGAAPGV